MPRIRSIKPELPEDETLGSCSRDARLTFILVWTRCDDYGRFRAAPTLLRGQLFPYDDVTSAEVEKWLVELADCGRLRLYEVDGQQYAEVVNWAKHQRIDNAGKALVPPPPDTKQCEPPQVSASLGEPPLDHDPDLDQDQERFGDPPLPAENHPPVDNRWEEALDQLVAWALENADQTKIRNKQRWRQKVRASLDDEHCVEAGGLLTTYPSITGAQLAGVISGNRGVLRLLERAS